MVFEVTQEIKRTASVRAESDSDALTLAKQEFEKRFHFSELVTYTVRPVNLPMTEMAAEELRRADKP